MYANRCIVIMYMSIFSKIKDINKKSSIDDRVFEEGLKKEFETYRKIFYVLFFVTALANVLNLTNIGIPSPEDYAVILNALFIMYTLFYGSKWVLSKNPKKINVFRVILLTIALGVTMGLVIVIFGS